MPETAFKKFDHTVARRLSSIGWDAWAEDYAQLPLNNPTYRFSKRLFYDLIDREFGRETGLDILDFNCGCGNDFAHLLAAGHRVVGCDGSAGMLTVAAQRYPDAISHGDVVLYCGQAQELTVDAFDGHGFDAIISATGGMAYLTDEELHRVHAALSALLKPGGCMIITHILPRCLIESLYYLLHARPRTAFRRWRSRLEISIKSEAQTMYFRTRLDLERILNKVAPADRLVPLNVLTPPFQTGYRLPDRLAGVMMKAERYFQRLGVGLSSCDQLAWISRCP